LVWSSHKGKEYLPLQWNLFPTNFVLFCWPKELWFFWISLVCLDYYSVFLFFFLKFFAKFFMSQNWKKQKQKKKPLKTLCQDLCVCFVSFQSDFFFFFGVMGLSDWPNTPNKKHTFSHCSQNRRLCNLLPPWFAS
jgi:hypothetical protein